MAFRFNDLSILFTPTCYRYFTWDAHKFPSSKDMINGVAVKGRKMVTIVDPHLKRDDNYNVYTDAKNRDMMVKGGGGEEYEGWCWPGKQYEGWCWPGKENEGWCWPGKESGKEKHLENSLKGSNIYICVLGSRGAKPYDTMTFKRQLERV